MHCVFPPASTFFFVPSKKMESTVRSPFVAHKTEIRSDSSFPTNPPQLLFTSSDVLQLLNILNPSPRTISTQNSLSYSPPRLPQKTPDEMAQTLSII